MQLNKKKLHNFFSGPYVGYHIFTAQQEDRFF